MSDEQKKTGVFTEAITLALIPAIGFGLAWRHEQGFCDVHKIPVDWIQLETTRIISASVKTATTLFFFFFVINQMTPEIKSHLLRPERYYLFIGLILLILIGVPYFLGATTLKEAKPSDAVVPIFVLVIFLIEFMYRNRIESDVSWSTGILRSFPGSFIIAMFALILISQVSYYLGVSEAKRQKWFLVPDNAPDFVLLRKYGDQVIMGRFDQKERILEPRYTFQSLGDADPKDAVRFNYKKVGPLRPWEKDD